MRAWLLQAARWIGPRLLRLGGYLPLLLLPGGTFIALAAWALRHRAMSGPRT